MRIQAGGPSGACWYCVSVAGVLVCLAGQGTAQPTSGAESPNKPSKKRAIQAKTCFGSVDGHVVDKKSHEPVVGATILANAKVVALTDEDGQFTIKSVCPGPMVIEAGRGDYQTARTTLNVQGAMSLELEVTEAEGEIIVVKGQTLAPIDTRSTAEVSGEALEKTRGRSFSEALAEVPGVAQLGSGSTLAKPIVRGQYGRRLLLLVGDLRHRSQDWGLDHAPEIDPFIADGITVVRGAAGVRYGPDAIGGAVVVTPPELRKTPGISGQAHLIGLAAQGGSLATRLEYAPHSILGLAAQVEGSVKRLAATTTPDYALDNTGSFESNLGATVGYRLGADSYQLSYRHYTAKTGVCRCLRMESSDDFFAQLELDRPIDSHLYKSNLDIERPFQGVRHDTVLVRAAWELSGTGTVTTTYGFQHDRRQEYDVVRTATGPQFDFLLNTHDGELRFEHNPYHINDHLHLHGSAGIVGTAQQHFYSGLTLIPDYQAWGGGVYAMERLLGHDFEIEAGIRYDGLGRSASLVRRDFLRLVRSDQLDRNACSDPEVDPVVCKSTFHTLSATLGGIYQVTDPWSVKANLATASRAPNPDEQYLNGTSPTFPVLGLGKPDLRPETTYSGSLTSSYQSEDLAVEASVYANYISDYIYFSPATNEAGEPIFDVLIRGSFPRFVTRPVDATFYGADGGLAYNLLPSVALGGQVSAVRAKSLTDNSFLVFVPPDRLRGSVTYTHEFSPGADKFYASVATTLVAKQNRFDLNADLAPPPDAYALLDGEMGWETQVGDQQIKVAAHGTNLLNTRYRDYTSLMRYFADQQGMQVLLRLSVHFSNPNNNYRKNN